MLEVDRREGEEVMFLPSSALPPAQAKIEGFRPLTVGYQVATERAALDAVQRDLDKGRINYVLVKENDFRVSVWRKGMLSITETAAPKLRLDPIKGRTLTV